VADVAAILDALVEQVNGRGEHLEGVDALYLLRLTGEGGGSYYLGVAGGRLSRLNEADRPPTATVTLAAEDFAALAAHEVSPMSLFLGGRIRLEGDLSQALRLEAVLRDGGFGGV
jgi:putative sterol carrier protein